MVSIQLDNLGASKPVNTVRFDGAEFPVQAVASMVFFTCPFSRVVGLVTQYLLGSDGNVRCEFGFAYRPAPASVIPKALTLRGGLVSLHVKEYYEFIGARYCAITVGKILEVTVFLNKTTFEIVAPPSKEATKVPFSLVCMGIPQAFDLGAFLQYVAPSVVSFGFEKTCTQFKLCSFSIIVTNPPPISAQGKDLFVRIEGASFVAVPPSIDLLPILQVRYCIPKSEFPLGSLHSFPDASSHPLSLPTYSLLNCHATDGYW